MSNFSNLIKHRTKRRPRDTAQLAAQLAPIEEQARQVDGATHESGAIIVNNDLGNLSADIVEHKTSGWWGLEPVVLVIIALMLAFIGFIAWQVSLMPDE